MGCLVSTANYDKEASSPPKHSLVEEETVVKEVLSETPKSKLPISRFSTNGPTFPSPNGRQKFEFVKNTRVGLNSQPQSGELSEDASEICSEFGDRDDDVSKIRNRSPAKYRNRDRVVGNSPGRRTQTQTQPSPGRSRSGSGPIGDANVRRSRSPATRSMSSPGRCPSVRRSNPGLVASTRTLGDDRDASLPPTNHESLDNPLVSLECFIFL